jgi:hypothetical protein
MFAASAAKDLQEKFETLSVDKISKALGHSLCNGRAELCWLQQALTAALRLSELSSSHHSFRWDLTNGTLSFLWATPCMNMLVGVMIQGSFSQ